MNVKIKKTMFIGVAGLLILAAVMVISSSGAIGYSDSQNQTNGTVKVGAIVALSGPSAIWGESLQNGMELALTEHPNITVIYEDSKGTAVDGLSAYQKLNLQEPDVFVSSLSIVSLPLASIAKKDKMVMIVTQSAADNITNEYVFRYYTDANHFATPSFESPISPLKNIKKIAVIYRNDEYAKSVANKIQELSKEQNKQMVFLESY